MGAELLYLRVWDIGHFPLFSRGEKVKAESWKWAIAEEFG